MPALRVIVLDSNSTDESAEIAKDWGAGVVQFAYAGGYPKKRQWALDTLEIKTPWVLFVDADEVIPAALWNEIAGAVQSAQACDGYLIRKGFNFLGGPMRYGGFSHSALLLMRVGKGRFEQIFDDAPDSLDMEIHERVIVNGRIGRLKTPLIHEDFKGLEAYIDRHNKYSTWEARLRYRFLTTGQYGQDTIKPRLFGDAQERRRFLKSLVIRLPCESWIWFVYHYVLRRGFLEGRRGLIACQIRASYIAQVRAKIYEMRLRDGSR